MKITLVILNVVTILCAAAMLTLSIIITLRHEKREARRFIKSPLQNA